MMMEKMYKLTNNSLNMVLFSKEQQKLTIMESELLESMVFLNITSKIKVIPILKTNKKMIVVLKKQTLIDLFHLLPKTNLNQILSLFHHNQLLLIKLQLNLNQNQNQNQHLSQLLSQLIFLFQLLLMEALLMER